MTRPSSDIRVPMTASLVVVVVTALCSMLPAQGQTVPAPPAAQAPGVTPAPAAAPEATAKITGQVVTADTGAFVKRARVMVMGRTPPQRPPTTEGSPAVQIQVVISGRGDGSMPPGMVRRETDTDETGRFEIEALPPGRFSVDVAAPAGFLSPASQPVELAAGGSASVTFRLDRAGAIMGRVLDHEGDPLARAQVMALQRRNVGGVSRLTSAGSGGGSASTDDLGQFRLFGLPPGDYYVQAAYTMPSSRGAVPRATPGAEPRLGYAPTYYPSTMAIESAQKVSVRRGQDTGGIEISLQRARMGTVSVRAADSTGKPLTLQRGYVSLEADALGVPGFGGFPLRAQEDGTFTFQNVPPGRYVLSARANMNEGPTSPQQEGAYKAVTVDGDEVVVDIQTNTGATVSGRVIVEGTAPVSTTGAPGQPAASRITVSARPADLFSYSPGFSSGRSAAAAEDGTFQLTGLRGSLLLQTSGPRAALKSVRSGGEDIMAAGLKLAGTEHIEGVTITLTTDTAIIDGTVTTGNGDPANAWILVFSDDEARWFPGSPFVRTTRTRPATATAAGGRGAPVPTASPTASAASRQPGGFMISTLLPGRYVVVAVPAAGEGSLMSPDSVPATDPESLEKLRAGAWIVSAVAGQTATVQLRLPK